MRWSILTRLMLAVQMWIGGKSDVGQGFGGNVVLNDRLPEGASGSLLGFENVSGLSHDVWWSLGLQEDGLPEGLGRWPIKKALHMQGLGEVNHHQAV